MTAPECPDCNGGIVADPNRFGEPDQATVRQCEKCQWTGKTAPEGPARLTYETEYGYQVWIGETKIEAYYDTQRAGNLTDKINRALSPITRKAEMCGRMADHVRYFIEWGEEVNRLIGHQVTPGSWDEIKKDLAEFDKEMP